MFTTPNWPRVTKSRCPNQPAARPCKPLDNDRSITTGDGDVAPSAHPSRSYHVGRGRGPPTFRHRVPGRGLPPSGLARALFEARVALTRRAARRRSASVASIALSGLLAAALLLPSVPAGATSITTAAAPVTDPAALVHPLDGTGTGPVSPGTVGEFPGADLPFGIIQWSPDTSPDTVQAGGGYSYADDHLNGFSLTHLSGTGCPSYQDVPILPTVGAVRGDPPDCAGHLLPPPGAGQPRSLPGHARPAAHPRLPGRDHAHRHRQPRPSRRAPHPTSSSRWPTAPTRPAPPPCAWSAATKSRAR